MAKNKKRRKPKSNQEASAAHGAMTDVRRSMRQAASGGNSMRWLVGGAVALLAFALAVAIFAP